MAFTKLVELKRVEMRNPLLIQGVPGLGLVGKIAVSFLIDKMHAEKVVEIYSDYLTLPEGSPGVKLEEDGIKPITYDIYWTRGNGRDLLLLTSEVQPLTIGQYAIANLVLDYAVEKGVDTVITLGGYVPGSPDVKGVFACTNDKEFMEELKAHGVNPLSGGYVTGAAGLLVGLAELRGLKSACLLGTTEGTFPDPRASKMVLEVIKSLYRVKVDLQELEVEAELAERILTKELEERRAPPEFKTEGPEERGLPYHL